MGLAFEWDDAKAERNRKKHGVTFEEAATLFEDPLSLTIEDSVHSHAEERFVILGASAWGRLLVAVHTERGDKIRIISAREATSRERRDYEQA